METKKTKEKKFSIKDLLKNISLVLSLTAIVVSGGICAMFGIQNNSLKTKNVELDKHNTELNETNNSLAELNAALNNQISDLNNVVGDLETTIGRYENEVSLVTYEVNGSVWKAEVVSNNGQITLPTIPANDTQVFRGWKVSGKSTVYEPSTSYKITKSTKFVAVIEMKAVVTYMLNGKVHSTVYVEKGQSTDLPSIETTETHYCAGWRVNGAGKLYNGTHTITQDIKFVADMRENPVVTLMANGEVMQTQQVKYDTYFTLPTIEDTDTHYFNGWKINGNGNSITEEYRTKENITFVLDMQENDWILQDNFNGPVAIDEFDNENIWSDGKNTYYSDDYMFNGKNWEKISWNISFGTGNIWTDGLNYYYSSGTKHYVLNDNTWEDKEWYGFTDFRGEYIWNDGADTYYSCGTKQYVLNGNTWEEKEWENLSEVNVDSIWSDGSNTYYSIGTGSNYNSPIHYVLKNGEWTETYFGGNVIRGFKPEYVWTDGVYTYYSYYSAYSQRVLESDSWQEKTWHGLDSFGTEGMWTDGVNYYCTVGTKHYMLNQKN